MTLNLDSITSALNKTSLAPGGVSFAGRGLKLNTAEDAKDIVTAIDECTDLQSLNLEGNTLGIDAAKVISEALEKKCEFKHALWKDLFTGRMKDEIPIALRYLGDGLLKANAKLVKLDLSDNAFGPIGVEGLASLLRSSCCFQLQELRLNNNGLGTGGGKILANALLDCYHGSQKEGQPLALKIFIAGRNRLENPGATDLAKVFKTIGTLEEIAMPQNGIYHVGITALADAFKSNLNLKILNLNDNTIGGKGARALAKAIPKLKVLRLINFGDCLLKTKGTVAIAESLTGNDKIEEIYLDCNEMRYEGALKLLNVLEKKVKIQKLSINGNCFGEDGCQRITKTLQKFGKAYILDSLTEDEGVDEDDEDSEEVASEEDQDDKQGTDEEKEVEHTPNLASSNPIRGVVSVWDFLAAPSPDKLIALGEKRGEMLLTHAKSSQNCKNIDHFLEVLMQVASISNMSKQDPMKNLVIKCCEQLWVELFGLCQKQGRMSILNNTLLVFLNLMKSEDKKFVPTWDIEGCLMMFESIVNKNYFPESTRNVLRCFIQRDVDSKKGKYLDAKVSLLKHLH